MLNSLQKYLFLSIVLTIQIVVNGQSSVQELKKLDSKAFSYFEKNNPKKAEETAYQILELEKNKKVSIFQVNAYTLLGIINKNRGFYINSLENNLHALNLSEQLKDSGRISACLNNIGVIYQLQNNYSQAIKYFSRSLNIEEKGKSPLQKSIRYYNLGDCYKELDSLDFALSYYNNSLLIEQKFKNNEGIVFAYLGIAEVYVGMKNYFQAKMILDKCKLLLTTEQIEENIIYHKLLGKYELKTGQFVAAMDALDKAEQSSIQNDNSSHLLELLLLKIDVYEAQQDISNANRIYKRYIALNNELTNSEIKNKIDDLAYQNELNQKELEIKLVKEERNLAKKNELFEKNLRIYGQKTTWFVIGILILTVALIFYGVKQLTAKGER